jgi:hypothetical protein
MSPGGRMNPAPRARPCSVRRSRMACLHSARRFVHRPRRCPPCGTLWPMSGPPHSWPRRGRRPGLPPPADRPAASPVPPPPQPATRPGSHPPRSRLVCAGRRPVARRRPRRPPASPPARRPAPPRPARRRIGPPTPPPGPPPRTPTVHEIPPEPPRDPNDAPFMRAPNNQPQPVRRGPAPTSAAATRACAAFAFTAPRCSPRSACPSWVARRRVDVPPDRHGVGLGGELDVQVIRWIWLRAQGSYSVHPVGETGAWPTTRAKTVITAAGGTIRAQRASAPAR